MLKGQIVFITKKIPLPPFNSSLSHWCKNHLQVYFAFDKIIIKEYNKGYF